MSDIEPSIDSPVADTSEVSVDVAPSEVTDAGEVVDLDALLDEEKPLDLDRARKLRSEARNLRVRLHETEERWQPWNEITEGFEPDDLEAVQALVRNLRHDPAAAEAMMRRYLGLEAEQPLPEPSAAAEGSEKGQYLTEADLEKLLVEREAKAQRDAEIRQIHDEASKLGYDPKAKPGTAEHEKFVRLAYLANHRTDGDIAKAHEALEAEQQAIIDAYVARQKQAANGAPTPPPAGGAPSSEREINSLQDARRAAMERVGARSVI